jgi:nicotinamidase-related amidase
MPLAGALHNRFADRLHPANAMVLVIDGQAGAAQRLPEAVSARVRNNLLGLAKIAGIYGMPSVFAVSDAKGAVLPDLLALSRADSPVPHKGGGLFDTPQLRDALRDFGRPHLIIAGLTEGNVLVETALDAVRLGYEVHVALDASTEDGGDVGPIGIARMSATGIDLTTWVAVLAECAAADGPGCREVQEAVGCHLANYSFDGPLALGFDGTHLPGFGEPA